MLSRPSPPPADLKVSWLFLPRSHSFAVLCSDLVREIIAVYPPPPALHMISSFIIAIKVLYAGFSQLCVMVVTFRCRPLLSGAGGWGWRYDSGGIVLEICVLAE